MARSSTSSASTGAPLIARPAAATWSMAVSVVVRRRRPLIWPVARPPRPSRCRRRGDVRVEAAHHPIGKGGAVRTLGGGREAVDPVRHRTHVAGERDLSLQGDLLVVMTRGQVLDGLVEHRDCLDGSLGEPESPAELQRDAGACDRIIDLLQGSLHRGRGTHRDRRCEPAHDRGRAGATDAHPRRPAPRAPGRAWPPPMPARRSPAPQPRDLAALRPPRDRRCVGDQEMGCGALGSSVGVEHPGRAKMTKSAFGLDDVGVDGGADQRVNESDPAVRRHDAFAAKSVEGR